MPRSLISPSRALPIVALALWSVSTTAGITACAVPTSDWDGGMSADTGLTEGGIIRQDAGPLDAPGSDAASIDAGADRCAAACDPRAESSSCLDEQRCILAGAEPMCTGDLGTASEGMPCESPNGCAPGLACFRALTGAGFCARVCCPGDELGCDAITRCGGDGVLVDGTETAFGRCALPRSCDVLSPELTCEGREGCYVVDGAGATECRIAGTAEAGELCVAPEDCAAGLFCGGLGERTCLRICSIAAPRACTSDERCIAQTYSPEGTGICVLTTGIR